MTREERYQYRKENGICTSCGKNKAADGKTRCQECLNKRNEQGKQYRENLKGTEKEKQIRKRESVRNYNTYNERKANGICAKCGKNQTTNGKALCEDCLAKARENVDREASRKKSKETYEWRKSHNLCPHCGKNKPFENHVLCADCLYDTTIRNIGKKLTQEQRERDKQQKKEKKQYREEHSLCKNCGKPLTDLRYKNCVECRNKMLKGQVKRIEPFRKRYREKEVCLSCGKPRIDGKFYCAECYQKQCESMAYARTFTSKEKWGFTFL